MMLKRLGLMLAIVAGLIATSLGRRNASMIAQSQSLSCCRTAT
jgi:hypothetical protein